MRVIVGQAERGPIFASALVLSALATLAFAVLAGLPVLPVAPVVALATIAAVAYQACLRWRSLLGLLILVILFIPIRRYTVPVNLPFQLEPYRILTALIVAAWLTSLLIDPRVRLRRSGLDGPLLTFVLVAMVSIVANSGRIHTLSVQADVVKKLTFFASFLLLFYLIVSVIRTLRDAEFLAKILVGGGAVLGACALIEARTGFNVFAHLAGVVPLLQQNGSGDADFLRGARLRVIASAQHPIALGAALVMLIPPAIYLARTLKERRWWLAMLLLGLGAFSTVSRTSILMLAVIALVFLGLRPRETRRFWPALVPCLLAVHFVLPGTLGTLKASFFPPGGLVAEQTNQNVGSGRVATLRPALRDEFVPRPLFGGGFGSRVVQTGPPKPVYGDSPKPPPILDDQWLGTLVETGIAGLLAWLWLFFGGIRRFVRAAKEDASERGWLLVAVAASVSAYAVGMLTYDSFSFIQVTFLLFIVLGIGAGAVSLPDEARQRPDARLEYSQRRRALERMA
jgi:O-antigen ligase/polysaccharide polymerase Wzy-like membrane protein